jgi:hypothetical protein
MLEKKLLTLASAAAIPACGACFLPPPPQHPPLPPPVRSALQSIHRIRVTAKNDSATHHLDPGDLAGQVASAINQQSRKSGARAIVDNAGGDADAVLEIIVENETSSRFCRLRRPQSEKPPSSSRIRPLSPGWAAKSSGAKQKLETESSAILRMKIPTPRGWSAMW